MNILLIILAVVFVVLLIAVNVYLLTHYIHKDDRDFTVAPLSKILIVLGLTLCQAQALLVPMDVANNSGSITTIISETIDMKSFWFLVYGILLLLICILFPFAIFFYETDTREGFLKRFGKSVGLTLLANIVSVLILFVSYFFLKTVNLPVHSISSSETSNLTQDIDNWKALQEVSDITLQYQASFAVYSICLLSFIGWILLVFCGGVGLFSLPIDLINEFRLRPKARKSEDMRKNKNKLSKAIKILLENGQQIKKLDQDNKNNEQAGFFNKMKGQRNLNTKLNQFKAKYYNLNQQFQIFNIQLKFSVSNPIVPIMKLILGIIFLITSILWVLQIIIGNLATGYFGRPLIPFMNELLIGLDEGNAGFLSTGIFAYLCLYMIWCVQKGTVKFGMRVPFCCQFHPMKESQTWINSFLFNIILMLIASVGVMQLCISSFPTYTRNTQIYIIIGLQLNYMQFYTFFYKNNIFAIAFVIWSFLILVFMLATCNRKPPYMKQIQMIRGQSGQ